MDLRLNIATVDVFLGFYAVWRGDRVTNAP
jgi:hypothetical protein